MESTITLIICVTIVTALDDGTSRVHYTLPTIENAAAHHELNKMFFESAKNGSFDEAKHLVENGADINAKHDVGNTALHVSVIEGYYEFIEYLVEHGANVNAKNDLGWTPLHLSSRYGKLKIANLLIVKGADINAKNKDGWTPLHVISEYGLIEIAQLFVEEGADIHAKTKGGWTALHISSRYGYTKITEFLVTKGANISTEEPRGRTALFIAESYGQTQVVRMLKNISSIKTKQANPGSFINNDTVQQQSSDEYTAPQQSVIIIVISVMVATVVIVIIVIIFICHRKRHRESRQIMREPIPSHSNINQSCSKTPSGICGSCDQVPEDIEAENQNIKPSVSNEEIRKNMNNVPTPSQPNVNQPYTEESSQILHSLQKVIIIEPVNEEEALKEPTVRIEKHEIFRQQNDSVPVLIDEYLLPLDQTWEFPRNDLTLGEKLGGGHFGTVYEGKALRGGQSDTVAVKMAKHSDEEIIDLVAEIELMKMISKSQHRNIIKLLGCCTQNDPLYAIIEYAPHGSLKSYIRHKYLHESAELLGEHGDRTLKELISLSLDVARGMEYLASRSYVHRDLAARNVLVCANYVAKIADFGLSRSIQGKEYYRIKNSQFPIRWAALESLRDHIYSTKSDVWSFGVLLWEIMTFGQTPYPFILSYEDLISHLSKGKRLECPVNCPDEIFNLMEQCWDGDPQERPTFAGIVSDLDSMDVHAVHATMAQSIAHPKKIIQIVDYVSL